MKNLFLFTLIFVKIISYSQSPYELKIKNYRDSVDRDFADSTTSILEKNDREKFNGIRYYEINESFKVKARFEPTKKAKPFKMQTTTSRLPIYKEYGKLHFELSGKAFVLTVYQNEDLKKKKGYEDYLFIPFTDLTSGEESYGGGRYLDMRIGDLTNPYIDFNLSYNPYCAYNSNYSCPIPPKENFINFRIEAGVKDFG